MGNAQKERQGPVHRPRSLIFTVLAASTGIMSFTKLWLAIVFAIALTWVQASDPGASPAMVLKPIAPPGHQKEHISTLHPRTAGKHFWTPEGQPLDPEMATMFAEANITYQHPAVILPHSDLIRYTFCRNDGIEIGYQSTRAYEYAKTHWTVDETAGHKFILVTESLHCNAADVGNHVYWLVSRFEYHDKDKVIIAIAEEVSLNRAYNDIAWGSTNPHNDRLGGAGTEFRGHARGLETTPRARGPPGDPHGHPAKRQASPALFQPWYANTPQANGTQLAYSSAMVTPQYYFTPNAGMIISPSDRFTVITLAPSPGSNTTGYLVYGYGGQSATQIQPNAYYSITNPARPLAPGYYLKPVAQGSCPVPLISYIFREPSVLPDLQAPSSREWFNVTAWANAAGLGPPLGSNLISVVNGQFPSACNSQTIASSASFTSSMIRSYSASSMSSPTSLSSSSISKMSTTPSFSSKAFSVSKTSSGSTSVKGSSSISSGSRSSASTISSRSSAVSISTGTKSMGSNSTTSSISAKSTSWIVSTTSSRISSSSFSRNVTLPSSSSVRNITTPSLSSSSKALASSSWSRNMTLPSSSSVKNSTLSSASSSKNVTMSSSSIPHSASASASMIPVSGSCSNPPEIYMGVVAAACGPGFDAAKDDKIGYFDLSSAGDTNTFVGENVVSRRKLGGGFFSRSVLGWLEGAAESAWNWVKQKADDAAKLATEVYDKAKDGFEDAVNAVKNTLGKPIDAPFNQNLPLNYHPGTLVDTPWGTGDAVLIFSTNTSKKAGGDPGVIGEIDVYCKDCGFTGAAVIYGELAFSIRVPAKLTALNIGIKGDLSTTIALGIEASIRYQKLWTRSLVFEYPPDVSLAVADMFTFGLLLKADATVNFQTKIEGEVLIGCSVDINGFDASVDLLHGSASQSGWTPKFNFDPSKDFQASAEVSASIAISVPVEFIFGIQIIPISFDKTIGIRNTPILTASTLLQIGTSGSTTGGSCPNGLSYDVDFVNSLDFDKGGEYETINKYTHIFADGCFNLPGLPHASSSSSAAAPTSQATGVSASMTSSSANIGSSSSTTLASSLAPSSVSSSISTSASAAPSHAPAPSSPFPFAPDSPHQYGDTEWAEIPGRFLYDFDDDDIARPGFAMLNDVGCALACQANTACTAAYYGPDGLCHIMTASVSKIFLAEIPGATAFYTTSCDNLSKVYPNRGGTNWVDDSGGSCSRFFPPPPSLSGSYNVDPSSPLPQMDQLEWASYPGYTATGLPSSLLTSATSPQTIHSYSDMTVEECARLCQYTTGCEVTDWQQFADGGNVCMGLTGTDSDLGSLTLTPTSITGEDIVFRATCEELAGYFPSLQAACNRFYPQTVSDSIFITSLLSPDRSNGPNWSLYTDNTVIQITQGANELFSPESLAPGFSPTTVSDCITGCQGLSGTSVAGVLYDQTTSTCTCYGGRVDRDAITVYRIPTYRTPFAPDQMVMVVFTDCVTSTGLRGDWGRLTCQNYYPGNPQIYGVALTSPLTAAASNAPEWGYIRDHSFRVGTTVQTIIYSKCRDIFCCASAAQYFGYRAANWHYPSSVCTIFAANTPGGNGIPDMVWAYNNGVTDAVILLDTCADYAEDNTDYNKQQFQPYTEPCKAWYQPPFPLSRKRNLEPSFPVPARRDLPGRPSILLRDDSSNVTDGLRAALQVSTILDTNVTAALNQAKQAAVAAAPNTVSIRDLTGTYILAPQANGNLLLTQAGSASFAFAVDSLGVVYGDGATTAFIYDLSEMNAFGVARFRYKSLASVARSSRLVTLVPINHDQSSNTPGVYVAIDATGHMFAPIVCTIAGEAKMFLARNVTAGIAMLQNPNLQVVVTGGPATTCAIVGLITTGQPGV